VVDAAGVAVVGADVTCVSSVVPDVKSSLDVPEQAERSTNSASINRVIA
jgi:hypothetical protein